MFFFIVLALVIQYGMELNDERIAANVDHKSWTTPQRDPQKNCNGHIHHGKTKNCMEQGRR